jgi:hypothetical protein
MNDDDSPYERWETIYGDDRDRYPFERRDQ